jgi:DNA invertase Pin-like site-specific DNA recombinase
MKAVVAYCRSASEPQRGPSPLLAQAQALGDARPEITEVYMDAGASGLMLERPALQRLITDCRVGRIATVVVQDPEDLSRDTGQLIALLQIFQKAGVRVEFAAAGDPVRDLRLSASGFTGL